MSDLRDSLIYGPKPFLEHFEDRLRRILLHVQYAHGLVDVLVVFPTAYFNTLQGIRDLKGYEEYRIPTL